MKIRYQLCIAMLIAGCGGLASTALIYSGNQPEQQDYKLAIPVVRVVTIQKQSIQINIHSQGIVKAETKIQLKTEVPGRIIKLSPSFVSGGFFKQGELLAAIDSADYELLIAQARAKVMRAKFQLAEEQAKADQARNEWGISGKRKLSPFGFHLPQVADKQENLLAAKAELKYAEIKKQRTEIRAPFDGRVRSMSTGVGEYVDEDSILGVIYSTDLAEVRLPVSVHELAFIDIPDSNEIVDFPDVSLSALLRGRKQTWQAKVVRSEGIFNEETGMMMLVVQFPGPYQLSETKTTSILPMGLFVEAEIKGRLLDNLISLPASVVINNNQVAIVDKENRIAFRQVEVLHKDQQRSVISAGMFSSDRVLISGLVHPVVGVLVEIKNDDP